MEEGAIENSEIEQSKKPFWIKILASIVIVLIVIIFGVIVFLIFSSSSARAEENRIPVICKIDESTILQNPVNCSISYVDKKGNEIESSCEIPAGKSENNYIGQHRCAPGVFIEKTKDVYPTVTAGFLGLEGCVPEPIKEENSYTIKCARDCANVNFELTSCVYSENIATISFERLDFESSLKKIKVNFETEEFEVSKDVVKIPEPLSQNSINISLPEGEPKSVKLAFLVEHEESLLLCGKESNIIACS